MLPDVHHTTLDAAGMGLSQCTYRCVVLPDFDPLGGECEILCLNAPTGAWCSLTYTGDLLDTDGYVSMHLQVRGAP